MRDANENPVACLLQKIGVGQPDPAASFAGARPKKLNEYYLITPNSLPTFSKAAKALSK